MLGFQPEAVREFRRAAMMTQKHFASYVGLSPAEISRLEGGYVDPFLSTVTRLSERLSVPLDALVVPNAYKSHTVAVRRRIRRKQREAAARQEWTKRQAEQQLPNIVVQLERLGVAANERGGVTPTISSTGYIWLTGSRYKTHATGKADDILAALCGIPAGLSRGSVLRRLRGIG